MKPFYITTPIYYVNAKPHLGHAYTTITADVMSRFESMKKKETFFLTGTDEHGDKIERAAIEQNLSPKVYADKISSLFSSLWKDFGISNNDFIRTTQPRHIETVKKILQEIYEKGDIYFSEYEGLYCFGCERFYTSRELVDKKCPDHQKEPEVIKEKNYFFKMSQYQDWLISHIKNNPDFIRPERYKNEILAFLKEPLEDLCISRPKSRLKWGITLPFDENYVTYVWFDALINYISALGYPDGELFKKFWPQAQHLVAKDIIKPHGIYWPIMLKAAGIPIFKHLNVHGYWNVEQGKMSKSLGNVVEPLELKNIYGLDAFRFFLIRDMVFGLDSGFSRENMIQRINSDLANDLGNLFSRTISMVHKYFNGQVPDRGPDSKFLKDSASVIDQFEKSMSNIEFHKALTSIWSFINLMNKYIDQSRPWDIVKEDAGKEKLKAVLYDLLEGLRIVSSLIYPVMPDTAKKMQKYLGMDPEDPFYCFDNIRKLNVIEPGSILPGTISLFPRIDLKKKKKKEPRTTKADTKKEDEKQKITIEDFSRVDLRVATVISAEKVARSDKLLKLEVDIGEKRTIVAGISEKYEPEDIKGKQVIIVANLKPVKLMGILSKGMVLAAVDDTETSVATIDRKVKPGTRLT